ncbi:MAG TPA: zinc-binding alcohol dehydrogenase [Devosiaceae bacterium]|jgi:2-desacetyl-2-hydroxyethyl bacteriochlorophyllide A dehydrogenase|nr:zinc-binding alcohol dehydrogenase [Devosiaceae bacterium]
MGYQLMIEAPRRVGVVEYEEPALAPQEVRLRTLYSGISAGTELTLYRGSNPYLEKSWNAGWRLFEPTDAGSWSYPHPAIGYEELGEVTEVGAEVVGILAPGQLVWGAWGHRSTHVVPADWALQRRLPGGVDPVCGIFGQIGSIALNAILDADIHLGETVAVFGQGVPGQMVTRLAKASGAEVVAIDRLPQRLELARSGGADHVINGASVDAAAAVKELTGGRGADVSIEISGSYAALHEAIRATARNSRVVVSGFYQGGAAPLRLGEEFHHNRVELVSSQIGGIARHLDHRWDRLRLEQTIMRLQQVGKVDFQRLITHRFPARDLQQAYELLDQTPEAVGQVVLEFQA